MLLWLLRRVWIVWFFFASLVLVNVSLFLAMLLVKPFFPRLFAQIAKLVVECWSFYPYVMETLAGWKIVVYGQAPPKTDRVLVIANHVEAPDWSVIFWVATAVDRIGYVKVVAKNIIRWIPVLGSAMVAMGTVFLTRSWEQDKKKIEATFSHLNTRGMPYWLLTHPEGTRFTAARAAESQQFSAARGLAPLAHVLQPRVKGFSTTVLGLGPSLESVLDTTICWDRPPAPMPGCFMGQGGPRVVHVHLAEFPVSQLPKSEDALQAWLYRRWAEKDRLVASFKATGQFDAPRVPVSIPYDLVNPRMFWWQTAVAVLTAALLYALLLR